MEFIICSRHSTINQSFAGQKEMREREEEKEMGGKNLERGKQKELSDWYPETSSKAYSYLTFHLQE